MSNHILIGGIRISPDDPQEQALSLARKMMKRAGFSVNSLHFRLYKQSIDARHRGKIQLVCTVLVQGDLSDDEQSKISQIPNARSIQTQPLDISYGNMSMKHRPMVVGMGPAGLFCALLLAENGYAPILIDRGDRIADRVRAVDRFHQEGILDTDSNIQFGAGGAGTFSDGKLITRIHDSRCSYVLERLHDFGAPEDILTRAKPHIGTDVLRGVVDGILGRIEECGGEIHYRTRLLDFEEQSDGSVTARTSKGDFLCSLVVLALGHSARDTYRTLIQKQMIVEPKPISVGVRIEHLQKDIDRALYGDLAGHPALGPAEYALSDTRSDRGVYTFCMCPGGEVVAAASEIGGVVVNGMSHHARDGRNANCAVAVSIRPSDYEPKDGSLAMGAIEYQRTIERAAYLVGGRDYSAPIQTLGDFMEDTLRREPGRIQPSYRNGDHVRIASLSRVLPSYVCQELRRGFSSFDQKIRGFACPDAVLSAAETRTSAPVRITRDEQGHAIGHASIYPCGEGAGYAGGITSAAVDGIRIAQSILSQYAPMR